MKGNKESGAKPRKTRKASTVEGRENQMIALAMDLVEERLRDKTATSAETVHFLKLASDKNVLEKQKLEEEVKLLKAKTEALKSAQNLEELYKDAMKAMTKYQGSGE